MLDRINGDRISGRRWTCLAVAVVSLCLFGAEVRAQEPDPSLRQARRHYWARRFAEAVPLYRGYHARHSDDVPAAVELGFCLLMTGEPEEAWQVLALAVASGRAGVAAETTWIDLSIRRGRPERALPVGRRLRRQYPENHEIARMLARLYEATGDHEAAVRAWSEVVERWPEDTTALRPLGRLRSWTGDLGGAEAALRRYGKAHPNDPEGTGLLASVLGWRWKWPEARQLVHAALRDHPGHPALRRLEAEAREYFAPKLAVRSFGWRDTENYRRSGVTAEVEAVVGYRLLVKAASEWARFHQTDPGYPVVRRFSSTAGLGWVGPERLKIEASYTRHESDALGPSSAFHVEARRALGSGVTGLLVAGRDDVTEKVFALLEKVRVRYASAALYREAGPLAWNLSLGVADYSDGPERLTVRTRIEIPLFGGLSGRWNNHSFWQRERSFLYFGPRRYSEQELLAVFRPLPEAAVVDVQCRAGGQWAVGDEAFGFGSAGDPGYVAEVSVEHHTPGAVRIGARAFIDRLGTESPYSGYGIETWLEVRF